MDKFIQIVEKFGLAGEKLLEFVREKLKIEEEKEEKRRQLEEEKEEKHRQLEEEKEHCKNKPVIVTILKGYNQLQKVILT